MVVFICAHVFHGFVSISKGRGGLDWLGLYIIYKVGIDDFQFNYHTKDHASSADNVCFRKIGMEIVSAIFCT